MILKKGLQKIYFLIKFCLMAKLFFLNDDSVNCHNTHYWFENNPHRAQKQIDHQKI